MSQATRLSLAIFLSFFAARAAELRGVVLDPQNRPVPNARITLVPRSGGLSAATSSGRDGAYRFDSIAAGAYLIQAAAPGFATSVSNEITLSRDSSEQKDVALALASIGEQIFVTASSEPQTSDEVSRTISSVSRDDAQNRDSFSLADTVAQLPGVRPQQLGGPGALTSIHIRGMRNQDTAVLVDGMRAMGFRTLLPEKLQAPIIVTFHMPTDPKFVFQTFYDRLKDRGYVIYPGKLTVADSFRIGCIGRLYPKDMQGALNAVREVLAEMRVSNGGPALAAE